VQLLAVLVLGILAITSLHIWSPVDEHAHFDYVQTIADQHRLPTLDPRIELGRSFGAHTYEAFQPPLYYVVAAPLLKLSHVHHTRILILRSFGLFLLLAAMYVFWRLAALLFPSRPFVAFAFGMVFFLLPGVIVRSVTVSYQPLATLVSLVFLFLACKAYRAAKGGADRWLLLAAATLGLALLTHVFLAYLAGVFAVVVLRRLWLDRSRRIVLLVACCAAIPVVIVGPWIAFNLAHYHNATANSLARKIQQPLINPTNHNYKAGDSWHMTSEYVRDFFLPNEWTPLTILVRGVKATVWGLAALLFLLPFVLFLVRPSAVGADSALLLGVPFILNLVLVEVTSVVANWPSFGRYLYGASATWMVFCYVATSRVVRSSTVVLATVLLGTAGAGYLWIEGGLKYL